MTRKGAKAQDADDPFFFLSSLSIHFTDHNYYFPFPKERRKERDGEKGTFAKETLPEIVNNEF